MQIIYTDECLHISTDSLITTSYIFLAHTHLVTRNMFCVLLMASTAPFLPLCISSKKLHEGGRLQKSALQKENQGKPS